MAGNMNRLDAIVFATTTATNTDQVVTRGFKVVDINTTTNTGVANNSSVLRSTAALPAAFSAVSTLIAIGGAADQIVRNVDLITAQATFATGDTCRLTTSGAVSLNTNLFVIPTSWIAG